MITVLYNEHDIVIEVFLTYVHIKQFCINTIPYCTSYNHKLLTSVLLNETGL